MRDFPADVEYSEWGEGPALLLLPGSFGTGSGWKAVTDRLARSHRIVTTSLLGYGATAERRPLGNSTMRQQTEVIDRILERIGEPTHVVGHSFGGLAALAHAIEGAVKPASLMLVEANPLGLLKASGENDLYAMFGAMTRDYFAEFEAGRPDAARHGNRLGNGSLRQDGRLHRPPVHLVEGVYHGSEAWTLLLIDWQSPSNSGVTA